MLREVLERGKYEQCQMAFDQAVTTEAQKEPESRKLWDGSSSWREEKIRHNYQNLPEGPDRIVSKPEISQEFTVPSYKDALQSHKVKTNSENTSRVHFDCKTGPATDRTGETSTNESNNSWDGLFKGSMLLSSPESSIGVGTRVQNRPSEKRVRGACDYLQEEKTPSKKRLDNVMMSLLDARQASRSRLQRTENALLGFPPSSPFTAQVQQALNALSARLSLMEQIEDGLASHMRKAYEIDYPESEGVIVDKVQLLCRMEEQQSLRAEWEEDMQQQLETISMLQAASRNPSSFTTPVKGADPMGNFQTPPFQCDWQEVGHGDAKKANCGTHDSQINGKLSMTATHSGSSGLNPSQQFQSPPDWKMRFEPLLGVDSTGLSCSPLVDYTYHPSTGHNLNPEFPGREHDGLLKARRKLNLTPSISSPYGV